MSDFDYDSEVSFASVAPGYWSSENVSPEEWSNYRWQMKKKTWVASQIILTRINC